MSIQPYQRVLSSRDARRVLLLGFFLRIPLFSAAVILTLHVVTHLHRSYAEAGLVSGAATVAIAVSGPWRGKLLDRLGLRRVVAPSLVVGAICWSIAPFMSYWWLLVLSALAGLFVVPTFSIIRQAVIAAVPESDRRTALSLDGVVVELSFMVGPLIGVWLMTFLPSQWVLFGLEMVGVVVAMILWRANPPLRSAAQSAEDLNSEPVTKRSWFRISFVAVCSAAAAATIVLSGSDVAIVAAVQQWGVVSQMAVVLVPWGAGSVIGGLAYGGMRRPISAALLLAGLAATTAPMAFAQNVWQLAALSCIAGLFCAPTITATVDAVARIVPERSRGEAMGWHGSFMTAGSALGAPIAGAAIDSHGFGGGFVTVSVVGFLVAGLTLAAARARRRQRGQYGLVA